MRELGPHDPRYSPDRRCTYPGPMPEEATSFHTQPQQPPDMPPVATESDRLSHNQHPLRVTLGVNTLRSPFSLNGTSR